MSNQQFVRGRDGKTGTVELFQITQPSRKQWHLWRHLLLAVAILVSGATSSSAATLFVTSTADVFHGVCSSGDCTIKDAIFVAETNGAPSNTIVLQNCAFYMVTSPYSASNNAFPTITTAMTIIGNGATIERASGPLFRFFEVNITGSLTVQNLTLSKGAAPINGGGAILNFQGNLIATNCVFLSNTMATTGNPTPGGAVYNNMGNVAIDQCSFRFNSAPYGGGFASDGIGGASPGISTPVTITHSSFVSNSALNSPFGSGDGGGIFIRGATTAIIRDTTVSSNMAFLRGGGLAIIFTTRPFPVELRNLTVVNNLAEFQGGGLFSTACSAVNCALSHAPDVANCIVANNSTQPGQGQDYASNSGFKSSGHNLLGPGFGGFGIDPDNGNFSANLSDQFLSGMLANLAPLAISNDAGGDFHAPLNGCIAINAGDASLCSGSDQLELPRLGLPGVCDIGAVEHRNCFVVPSGLQAWWSLAEKASPSSAIGGNGANKGIWVGTPASTPGRVGRALAFNGVNQFIKVLNNPSIDFTNACDSITIDAWIKTCASGLQVFIDKRVLTSGFSFVQGYELFVFNGRLGFQMANGHTFVNYVAPVSNLSDNRWHLVAVTVSRCPTSSAQGTLFVDGNVVLSFVPLTGSLANTADLLIGGGYNPGAAPSSFKGSIDEPEIFKSKLKNTQILRLYQAGWAGKCLF